MLLELLAYLLIGALAGLFAGLFGIGGGAIMVPALILLLEPLEVGGDWVAHLAVGSSLATIVGTALASTWAHQRRQGVRWDLVVRLAPGILLGAWLGALVAAFITGLWLQRLFALFLALVGWRLLTGATSAQRTGRLPGRAGLTAIGGVIGLISTLVGIGGGSLTVPYLHGRGIDMRQAVGTSAACGIPIALAGALGLMVAGWGRDGLPALSTGFVYWPAVAMLLLTSMPMAPLGARLAHTLPVATLKRGFGVLLLLIALRLAW